MTENEAIKVLEKPSKHIRMVHKTKNEMEFYTFSSDLVEAFEVAIKALEEIQQYRAIGTVEECRQYKVDIQATRNATIDEFSEKLKYELNGNIFSNKEKCAYDRKKQEQICHQNMTLKRAIRYAEVIAEKMKGSADNV